MWHGGRTHVRWSGWLSWLARCIPAVLMGAAFWGVSADSGVAMPVRAQASSFGPSASVLVTGAVQTEMTFAVADLQALPTRTVMAETRTRAGTQGVAAYRGVLLKDVLDAAKVQLDPNIKNDALSRTIIASGSDGYRIAFAYGEIDPDFAGQPVLVAFEKDGQPLADSDGTCELVVPGDKLAGRWVKNLVSLSVMAPAIPAA